MKHNVRSVRDKSVTNRQEAVGVAKHDLITSGAFWFSMTEIRYPPSAKLPHKDDAVADPKPHV